MSTYSQSEPGSEYVDLRDVAARFDAIDHDDPDEVESESEFIDAVIALADEIAYGQGIDGLRDAANDEPTMIADYYFVTYAREFAEDIGAIGEKGQWPTYCIDWEWAARELAMDYTMVEFGDTSYYWRGY
jgi:hypothetical protein